MNISRVVRAGAFLGIFAVLIMPSSASAGFGISPPWLENLNAVPGAEFEKTITVSQEKVPESMGLTVSIEGDPVASWIRIKGGESITIPQGATRFPVHFIVSVPDDAKLGFYEGVINLTAGHAQRDGSGQISIALGAQARVKIALTDEEISDFSIAGVTIPDLEIGWPLEVEIKIENKGNTNARPSRVVVRVWDDNHANLIGAHDITNMEEVPPFQNGISRGSFDIELDLGQYWADLEIYQEGELVLKDKLRFEVFPEWTLTKKPILLAAVHLVTGSPLAMVVTTFIGTLLLVGVLFLFVFKKRVFH